MNDTSFFEILLWMFAFYLWFVFIWVFIRAFSDVFIRKDISGIAKAGWILFFVVFPFLGILIYFINRPVLEQDRQFAQAHGGGGAGVSAADELTKLGKLRDAGDITQEEYATLKERLI